MSLKEILLSGRGDQNWTTPNEVFNYFDSIYKFEIDVCASKDNHLCAEFLTKEDDALLIPWEGKRVWCNPPFDKAKQFVECACEESAKGALVCMVIPANLNTCYWHDYILDNPRVQTFFPRRGLKFGGAKQCNPCPVAVVIFFPPGHETKESHWYKRGNN